MRNHISHHFWNEEEVIIVYPDCIASFILAYDDFCKGTVDRDIMFPTILLPNLEFRIIGDLIVKYWPENLLAITVIMTFEIGVGDEHRNRMFPCIEECTNIRLLSITQCIGRLQFSKIGQVISPFRECQSTYNLAKLQRFGQNGQHLSTHH